MANNEISLGVRIPVAQRAPVDASPLQRRALLLLKVLSDLFCIMGFTIYIGGGVQLLIMLRGAEGFSTSEGDLLSQVIYLLVYAATGCFLLLSLRRIHLGIFGNFWFWLLVFWTCASIAWSGAPFVTIRQVTAVCGTLLFSVYLVNTLDIQKYVRLLAVSLLIVNVASYFMIFLLPEYGIMHIISDEWRGIFTHKNHLGKAVSLSLLVFLYLALTVKKGKWIWLFAFFSSIGLLLGAQSAAAIMISLYIVMVIIGFYIMKKMPRLLWMAALVGVTGVTILMATVPQLSLGQLLGYFGKDETLTGRTALWEFCVFMAQKKPLLGYGYGAFWLGSEGPSAEIWSSVHMGTDSNHCHNGFMDVMLGVGGIGLFLVVVVGLIAVARSCKFLFSKRWGFQSSIYLLLLLWILPYNISEQALLYRNNIFWVLFSSVVLYQSRNWPREIHK